MCGRAACMYVCIGRFEQLPDHGRRDLVRCNRRYVPGTSLLNIVTAMESFYLPACGNETSAPPSPNSQVTFLVSSLRRRRYPWHHNYNRSDLFQWIQPPPQVFQWWKRPMGTSGAVPSLGLGLAVRGTKCCWSRPVQHSPCLPWCCMPFNAQTTFVIGGIQIYKNVICASL